VHASTRLVVSDVRSFGQRCLTCAKILDITTEVSREHPKTSTWYEAPSHAQAVLSEVTRPLKATPAASITRDSKPLCGFTRARAKLEWKPYWGCFWRYSSNGWTRCTILPSRFYYPSVCYHSRYPFSTITGSHRIKEADPLFFGYKRPQQANDSRRICRPSTWVGAQRLTSCL
jgi:hypothetical protein